MKDALFKALYDSQFHCSLSLPAGHCILSKILHIKAATILGILEKQFFFLLKA